MENTDPDQSRDVSNTDSNTATDGDKADNQTNAEDTGSMFSETWEKLAAASGLTAIIAVLILPVLSLNVPESVSQMMQSAGVGGGLTLRDAQDLMSTFVQLSTLGGSGSTTQQLSMASTLLNVSFYAIISGGGLLIAGAAKRRRLAIAGAVIQTLLVLGLTYAVFVLIPDVINEQLGSGVIGSMVGDAASQLVGPGVGLYLLIVASVGAIGSVAMVIGEQEEEVKSGSVVET